MVAAGVERLSIVSRTLSAMPSIFYTAASNYRLAQRQQQQQQRQKYNKDNDQKVKKMNNNDKKRQNQQQQQPHTLYNQNKNCKAFCP